MMGGFARNQHALGIRHEKMPIARRGISATPSRHAPCQTTGTCKYCPFGARFVACDYLDDLRAWNDVPNLEVRPGVAVDRLLCSDKHTIAGAEYRDGASGETVKVNATRVIVAAGTIESAKLLQRSTSPDWPNGIGNDADLVGRHFVTHPYFIYTGSRPANSLKLQPEMNFPTLFSRHFDSEAEQARGKFILVNPPDSTPFDLAKLMQAGYDRDQIDTLLVDAHPVQLHGMVEVFGEHNNRVGSLTRRNRIGLHETEVNYSAAPGFTARMAEIKAQVQRIFAAMGATLVGDASVSWRADHAGSTCRMSTNPADGVVDPTLRVHGVDNLYVCSNAVFPAIGAVNPTLTLTALALRLADRLSGAI